MEDIRDYNQFVTAAKNIHNSQAIKWTPINIILTSSYNDKRIQIEYYLCNKILQSLKKSYLTKW